MAVLDAAVVARCDWLRGVPSPLVGDLVAASQWRCLGTGEVLAASGDAPDQVFVAVSGRIGAWRGIDGRPPEPGGHGVWYWISGEPPVTAGLENLVADSRWFASLCVQAPDTDVLVVPAAAVHALLAAHPPAGVAVAAHIARRLQAFTEQVADLALLDVARRVAKYLLEHRDGPRVLLPDRQADLADRLAASRQRVNAALALFDRRGWIRSEGRGRWLVVDAAALDRYAGASHAENRERHR
ncbi:Crp/Fnr family transcriptional regulator [Jatrophihabitans sp. YIM 134969]